MNEQAHPFLVIALLIFIAISGYILILPILEIVNSRGTFDVKPFPSPQALSASTAQANNATDWKTYRNEKYGYQIQFPDDTVLITHDLNLGAAGEHVVNTLPPNAPSITLAKGIQIVLPKKPTTYEGTVSISLCEDCGGGGVGIDNTPIQERVNLDGTTYNASGFVSNNLSEDTHKFMSINLQRISILYGFSSEYRKPFNQDQIDVANKFIKQILSTFKFK